jgi:hypothetical protein
LAQLKPCPSSVVFFEVCNRVGFASSRAFPEAATAYGSNGKRAALLVPHSPKLVVVNVDE